MATSKIKSLANNNKTWTTGQGQTMYEYQVELEDGVHGIASSVHADNPPYSVGDSVEYSAIKNEYGTKLKIKKENSFSSSNYKQDPTTQKNIENSWAIQTAVNILGQHQGIDVQEYLKGVKQLGNQLLKLRDTLTDNTY